MAKPIQYCKVKKIKLKKKIYASTTNAEEAEVEQFYDDLQNLLELTPKKDILFIIGDWNAKVGSQEIPGVKGKFDFGAQNEAGQRLTEFCQEKALVIANTLFQQLFPILAASIYVSTNNARGFPFLHTLSSIYRL